jgi:uncharacterized protein with ParB-like and HNH nuclease domain
MDMSENLVLKAISDLNGYTFTIPYQQRGYRWTEDNINKLLDDFKEFVESEKKTYCLQPIAIVEENKAGTRYSVIDGQQRLTTLYLLHKYLSSDGCELTADTEFFHYEYDRDNDHERSEFLRRIISEDDNSKIDFYYISHAYNKIKNWFEEKLLKDGVPDEKINKLKDRIRNLLVSTNKTCKSVQVIWYLVDKGNEQEIGDKEHKVFRNINSGKIQLSNSDLIKALLLNRDNKIENKEQIAAQFEIMQRQFAEDRFWYMLKSSDVEPQKGQSRMDFIFNLLADIKNDAYQIDSRKSFYTFSSYKEKELEEMWKKAREKYQRLKDLFDDPYTFHYTGFLIYCGTDIKSLLKESEKKTKTQFCNYLKEEIKKKRAHGTIEEYSYSDNKGALRRLFVLHNIETILQRYESLKKSRDLRFSFEYFPFELLYSQTWHIEHIASHTDNDLKSDKDRMDWIESILEDYDSILSDDYIRNELEELKNNLSDKREKFDELYNKTIKEIEKAEDITPLSEDEKNSIGNLVLLDEHTNTSFHNSLFPRKRRIVIIASGLRNEGESESITNIKSVYIPICTQQVYTKSYNKQSNVKLNSWGKDDCDAYLKDMKEKLAYYFGE